MEFIAIIPARYGSSRFPGKPLADLGGMTVIERVYRQVVKAVDRVAVATDDTRIARAVEAFGGKAVMTSADHQSGTDRCMEAWRVLGGVSDVVINVQGDEPFIDPDQIRTLMACFDSPETDIATLARPVAPGTPYEIIANPNRPKVTVDSGMNALLFSRSVIPYVRGVEPDEWTSHFTYLLHVGMYAYRCGVLERISCLPRSPLETVESLEQLRWLQAGFRIKVGLTDCETIGIDTPEDLVRAKEYIAYL